MIITTILLNRRYHVWRLIRFISNVEWKFFVIQHVFVRIIVRIRIYTKNRIMMNWIIQWQVQDRSHRLVRPHRMAIDIHHNGFRFRRKIRSCVKCLFLFLGHWNQMILLLNSIHRRHLIFSIFAIQFSLEHSIFFVDRISKILFMFVFN